MPPAVILLDPEPRSRRALRRAFGTAGWRVFTTIDAAAAANVLAAEAIEVAVVRLERRLAGVAIEGLEMLARDHPAVHRVLVAPPGLKVTEGPAVVVYAGRSSATRITRLAAELRAARRRAVEVDPAAQHAAPR